MKNTKPKFYTSDMNIAGSGIRIRMEISNLHNKAYRKNFLQALTRAIHAEMKFMRKRSNTREESVPLHHFRTSKGELGSLIREKRTSLGLNQETFAKILQIDRTYVSKLEHGLVNPSLALMRKISELGNSPPSPFSHQTRFTSMRDGEQVLH